MHKRIPALTSLKGGLLVWFGVMLGIAVVSVAGLHLTREENAKIYTYADKPAPPKTLTSPSNPSEVTIPPPQVAPNPAIQQVYGQLPLSFEPNLGQTDNTVRYLARASGYRLFLTDAALVIRTQPVSLDGEGKPVKTDQTQSPPEADSGQTKSASVVKLSWLGANPTPKVSGQNRQSGYSNYFIGSDTSKHLTEVPHYGGVRYGAVYEGIDLKFHSQGRTLQYDFELAPYADPKQIRLGIEGVENLSLTAEGAIAMEIAGGKLYSSPPIIYQEGTKGRTLISGGYVLESGLNGWTIGFAVGQYDPRLPLVIDPLIYSTYLGGDFGSDVGNGIAVDGSSNAYITGFTNSNSFPTTTGVVQPTYNASGETDIFVSKLNATGSSLIYSTYLGGSGSDFGNGLAIDGNGNVYITGDTVSTNFPTTTGVIQPAYGGGGVRDAFVSKLNATGTALLYSTYLGGNDTELGRGIAVDGSGNAYVIGDTQSANFPTTTGVIQPASAGGGFSDAFVSKLNATGTALLYSTYLGGSASDIGRGIVVDESSNVYIVGDTVSTNFPTTTGVIQPASGGGGFRDAFVSKLNATGSSLLYSTYLGGNDREEGYGIAVDSSGNAYVTGFTESGNFPTTTGVVQPAYSGDGNEDVFVSKLDATGSSLLYSTFLGKDNRDAGRKIVIDASGNAYISGFTNSNNYLTTTGAIQPARVGGDEAFITKLNATGNTLLYSTYLGGSSDESGNGLAIDGSGNAYVTGNAGSSNFPTTTGVVQPVKTSSTDAFVSKIQTSTPTTLTVSGGNNQSTTVNSAFANPLQVTLQDQNGQPISSTTISFTAPGSGASATFSTTATTNASGIASITATANGITGTYSVIASVASLSATFTLTNTPNLGTVKLLTNTVRVASTQAVDGLNSPKLTATNGVSPTLAVSNSTAEFTIGGNNGIPANATGIFGVLTNVGCSGGGNFRFFTTAVPNAANLNVPGANPALNLSTNFIAPLSGGKVKLGLGSGNTTVSCGYVVDVNGYITAPDATSDRVTLLANTVRVASTQAGDNLNSPKITASNGVSPTLAVSNSTAEFSIGGNFGIPAGAKGIIGVLTNVGCTGGGNFRFFTTAVPNAANLNVPGALPSLNLSTGFITALDGSGKVKLGLGSGSATVNCGYVLDVVGYITAPDSGNNLTLLSSTVRVASTQAGDNLNSPKITATNGVSPTLAVSNSTVEFALGGNFSLPSGAKGVFGVLVNVGCSGGGNFRFFTASVPNAANLNVPGAFPALNLSTGFTAGLDANGKVKLGLGSGAIVTCGYVTDVVGYLS